jgi:hypothetical protein
MGCIIPFFAFSVLHVYLVVGDYSRLWCGVEMEDENSNRHSSLNGVVSVIFRVPSLCYGDASFCSSSAYLDPWSFPAIRIQSLHMRTFFYPGGVFFFGSCGDRRFSEGVRGLVDAAELMISLLHITSCHVIQNQSLRCNFFPLPFRVPMGDSWSLTYSKSSKRS